MAAKSLTLLFHWSLELGIMTKRKTKRKLAKRRFLARQTKSEAGNILDYIQHLNPESKEHQQYTFQIVLRESTKAHKKFLKSQFERVSCYVELYGLRDRIIPKYFRVIASVIQPENKKIEFYNESQFSWLAHIAGSVWSLKYYFPDMKIALLFESRCRAIRPDDWESNNRDAPISKRKLEEFAKASLHLPIFTIFPPEFPQDKIESLKRKVGFEWEKYRKLAGLEYKYPTDRLSRYEYHDEVIDRYKSHLKINKKKSLSWIYTQIYEEMKFKVEKSTIKYWCQLSAIDSF